MLDLNKKTSKRIFPTLAPSGKPPIAAETANELRGREPLIETPTVPLAPSIDSVVEIDAFTSDSKEPIVDGVRADISSIRVSRKRAAMIANVWIDSMRFIDVVAAIVQHARECGENEYVVTPNAHHVMMLQRDEAFRRVYEGAFLVVPDGVPMLWASKLLDQGIPERVNGTDLFEAICAAPNSAGLRIFLLGGREGAADAAADRLRAVNPSLVICGTYCPPFGFEHDEIENEKIVASINAAKTDILFVGLGAPKQEFWMADHRSELTASISVGIGVSFEFVAGVVPRAPKWMQKAGLEWLFRLCSEPNRLWRRYIVGNAVFGSLIAKQFFGKLFALDPPIDEMYASDRVKSR